MYKAENFENAVKTAFTQGMAKGKLGIVKDIKRINFEGDGQPTAVKNKSISEQVGEALLKQL